MRRALAGGGCPSVIREPHILVMGAYTGPVDEAWVGHLHAAARGANPIKWQDVQDVLTSSSADAAGIRDGLATAVIVIVDPMAFLRRVDFEWAGSGRLPPFAVWYDVPELRALRRRLERWAADGVIATSGVSRIVWLLTDSLGLVDLGDGDGHSQFSPEVLRDRLGGGLLQATRLAASATTAIAYEDDPDGRRIVGQRLAALASITRYVGDDFLTRARLEAFADRQVVFDQGHEDVIRVVTDLHHKVLERHARYAPYLGLEPTARGYITTADDRQRLRLQIADVAAGYARDVLATYGHRETVKRFRLVLFNGSRLDLDDAQRYDDERNRHRTLVAKCLGGGTGKIHVI